MSAARSHQVYRPSPTLVRLPRAAFSPQTVSGCKAHTSQPKAVSRPLYQNTPMLRLVTRRKYQDATYEIFQTKPADNVLSMAIACSFCTSLSQRTHRETCVQLHRLPLSFALMVPLMATTIRCPDLRRHRASTSTQVTL